MEDNRIDAIELELNQLSEAQLKADHELEKAQVEKVQTQASLKKISATVERLAGQRRELGERRKKAIGLAIYDSLETAGLRDAMAEQNVNITEIPARVRWALAQQSKKSNNTLAHAFVIVIAQITAEDKNKKPKTLEPQPSTAM
jgi:hypothetical protein